MILGAAIFVAFAYDMRVPFTIKELQYNYPGGVRDAGIVFATANRSDGSSVVTSELPNDIGKFQPARRITDYTRRKFIVYDPADNSAFESPIPESKAEAVARFLPGTCESYFKGPGTTVCEITDETLIGYRATRVTKTFIIPGKEGKLAENWKMVYMVAPELNYAALRIDTFRDGHPVNTKIALTVIPGEPDPSLFVVPSSAKQLNKISEAIDSAERLRGRPGLTEERKVMMDIKLDVVNANRP